jgi:hypothetical protein
MKRLLILLLALTGCMSLGPSRFTSDRGACATRPDLVGEWRSSRSSQVGSSSMTLTLRDDCRYTMHVGLTFGRIKEEGEYRIEGDRIVLSRTNGSTTSWPFVLDGETLRLTEAEGETHEYSRR